MIDLASMRAVKYLTRDSGSGENLLQLSKHREKGLWSFLTWSFFISQVLVAGDMLGAPARAGETLDDKASGANAAGEQGAPGPLSGPDAVTHADTSLPGLAAATYPVAATGDALPIMLAGVPVDPSLAATLGLTEGTAGSYQGGTYYDAAPTGEMLPGQGHDDLPHLPGPGDIGGVLDPILGQVPPVIDAVGHLLDPILDQLPPVLGAVGNVVGTVENVVTTVVTTVDHAIAPVIGIVGDLTHALEPVLDQVASPLTELVGDTALQPVVGLVTDLAGPVTSLLGLGNSSQANSASAPIALTSGSLDLDHTLSPGGLLNDLFSGGRYTDYNLALQSHHTDSGAATAPAVAGSGTLLSLLDHVVGASGDGHDPQAEHGVNHAVSLPSILDDIALRGLGDGISG